MKAGKVTIGLLAAWVIVISSIPLQAVIYPFEIFTNSIYDDDPGINIYVDVFNGNGTAKFQFFNDSTIASSITGIYFDDGTLLDINSIDHGPGTLFAQPASPGNLPSGNDLFPPFITTGEFSVDGSPPPPLDGVNNNAGEWVTIIFDLKNGGTLQDVLDELDDGTLRIGLHITAIGVDEESESAVNGVPEPATICLFGLGAVLLRKRRT